MATSTDGKVRENRLRRMAHRQGFSLRKSRRRDPHATDYGEMWLLREMIWSGGRWEAVASPEQSHDAWEGPFYSLDDVERYLNRDDR